MSSFPPCLVFYLPPEIAASQALLNQFTAGTQGFEEKGVDLARLHESLRSLFHRYIDEVASGGVPDPENYKWNLYREIDIPNLCLLAQPGHSGKTLPPGTIELSDGLKRIFQTFNEDSKIANAFVNASSGGYFRFTRGHPHQQEFEIAVTQPAGKYGGIFSLTKSQPEGYKIHLTPKPDYALYTLLRFYSILKNNEFFHAKRIYAKIIMNFRDVKPREDNTWLAEANGGSVPTIVLYSSHDRELVSTTLNILLESFKNEVVTLGTMTPDYKYRILPFNVRLNSLLQYAQGDRTAKLRDRAAFLTGRSIRGYFMPRWVQEIITECNTSVTNKKKKRELSTLSLQLLGKDLCSPELQAALSQSSSADDINWMTAFPSSMIDPRTLENFELEAESAGSEEADTSANNAVVEDPTALSTSGPIGAGAGAPSGGSRKKYQKTKKNKKTKRHRRLSRRGLRN